MNVADDEDAWLARALDRFRRAHPAPAFGVGPGDDAASVRVDGAEVVVATDVLVDGVHFRLAECGPEAAAAKALKVNLSDLAAMGAEPLAFLVGGVLPRPADSALFDALMTGFADAAAMFDCPCAGGDTNVADGPLVLAVTVLGRPGPWGLVLRSGAEPGNVLSVTGALGGSLAGRHLTFTPRLAEARVLCGAGVPKAMIDLSDGLGRDLPRLCRASGVGARLDAPAIPVHEDALRGAGAADDPLSALDHALGDGEDFELLLAHRPLDAQTTARLADAGVTLHPIGSVTDGTGVVIVADGTERPLEPAGYDHVAGGADGG